MPYHSPDGDVPSGSLELRCPGKFCRKLLLEHFVGSAKGHCPRCHRPFDVERTTTPDPWAAVVTKWHTIASDGFPETLIEQTIGSMEMAVK